jgi:hypothetical protein
MPEIVLPSGISVLTHADKKMRRPIDLDATIQAVETLTAQQESREIWQKKCELFLRTTGYVLASFWGDLHLGNAKTDHARFLRMVRTIQRTPNTFVALGGDEVDNAFIFREGGRTDVLTEQLQGEVCATALKDLDDAGKILFIGTGNHNFFVSNWYDAYGDEFKAPILGPNTGECDLHVNDEEYKIAEFHKISMGNSTMSPFLREQRAIEYWYPDADIVAGFHTHRKAIGQYNIGLDGHKKLRTLIEAGTMKPDEDFQRREGNMRMAQFDYTGAGVLLNPDKHEVIPFYDMDQGIEMLQARNGLRTILEARTGDVLSGRR